MYKVAVITLSDRASKGEYEDLSGPYLTNYFNEHGYDACFYDCIADDEVALKTLLEKYVNEVDLIITTGGTGLSKRDITVDVVEDFIDYEVRGMSVGLHAYSISLVKTAMYSRAICGVKDETLIITMPGSLKAVTQLSEFFIDNGLEHGLHHLKNKQVH